MISGTPTRVTAPMAVIAAPNPVVSALVEEARRAAAAGRRAIARQRYESALYLLAGPDDALSAPVILRGIARTYLDDGDVLAALDCLTAALAIAEACENTNEIAYTINIIGNAYVQRGLLEESAALYEQAGRMAEQSGNEHLIAMVEQNLGIIAGMRGDDTSALRHHESSVKRFRALGLQQALGRQLNNVGLVYSRVGRLRDADRAFQEAIDIARRCDDTSTMLMVEVNRVELLIQRNHLDAARSLCDHVLIAASAMRDTRLIAETYKHYGVIARATGALDEADNYLRLASDQAMEREDLLLAAETTREHAEVHLALGRNRDALQALSTSHRLFTRLRAQRDAADVTARLRKLEQRFQDLVRQWAQSIESKDVYTLGHCERVAQYACAIAVDMGFDETTLFWFRVGALLHDVGKIVVPSDILNKAGPLTPEERSIMERHPVAGVELLRDIDFPWDVLPMIRGHHERWDGHGYPDGLAGDSIPLAARILCVADVYDALSSDRPYRRAFAPEDTLRLMQAETGRQFDPEILARFVRLVPGLAPPRPPLANLDIAPEAGIAPRPRLATGT